MLSFCLFYFHTEHIMSNTRLEESQTRIKIARRNINNLRYADDTTLIAESEEELKSLWWGRKRRAKKLKVEQWQIFFSRAPKSLSMVTVAMKLTDSSSLEEKLWQKLDSVLKSRDITLLTKVLMVKTMVSPAVMYGYENWTIKKAEHWISDVFELWCWRRLSHCKEFKPVNPKGNQPWMFTGGTVAETEAPILWPADAKSRLIEKDPDTVKDWRPKEKRVAEDEIVR